MYEGVLKSIKVFKFKFISFKNIKDEKKKLNI